MFSSIINKYKKKRKIKKLFPSSNIDINCRFNNKTILGGYNTIYRNVNLCSSKVGIGTFFGNNVSMPNCCIGSFCSIGSNISVVESTHPMAFVSTYPSFFNTVNKLPLGKGTKEFNEFIRCDNGFSAIIGNDVWIGDNVIIKGGVSIGDGSVIGMGSVVTKDVPPYAIVCGNPASIIRYRFNNDEIKKLLSIKWWEWELDYILQKREDFTDLNSFLSIYEK